MRDAILVEELVKRYGDIEAVAGISFAVGVGEIFGLLGPNGAGKTTTLEIVEGLRQADGGRVTVLGQAPWPRNRELSRRIGVQLQRSSFFERLTTREQLRSICSLHGAPANRVDRMIDLVGLRDRANERTDRLSGGQQQRLAIAVAIAHDPELVFLDEPSAALDPQARRNLWDVIRDVRDAGKTVVLTTHHLDEAEALCDRVAIMDHGRLLALDEPSALSRSLAGATRISLPVDSVPADELPLLPGAESVRTDGPTARIDTHDPGALLAALAARDALAGIEVRGPSLVDVFLSLTGREYRA